MNLLRSYSISLFLISRLQKPYVISYIVSMYANYGDLYNDGNVKESMNCFSVHFLRKEMRLDFAFNLLQSFDFLNLRYSVNIYH